MSEENVLESAVFPKRFWLLIGHLCSDTPPLTFVRGLKAALPQLPWSLAGYQRCSVVFLCVLVMWRLMYASSHYRIRLTDECTVFVEPSTMPTCEHQTATRPAYWQVVDSVSVPIAHREHDTKGVTSDISGIRSKCRGADSEITDSCLSHSISEHEPPITIILFTQIALSRLLLVCWQCSRSLIYTTIGKRETAVEHPVAATNLDVYLAIA